MTRLVYRLRGEAAGVYRIVRSYPSTLAWPLLLLALVLGLGIWAVNHVSQMEESHNKDQALNLAIREADFLSQQLTAAISPLRPMSAIVEYNPQYNSVKSIFGGLAPALLAQTPSDLTQALEYLPNGVLRDVYPRQANEAAIGLNLFASAEQRQEAVEMVRKNITTLSGPHRLVQGWDSFIVRTPIFVSGADFSGTFGMLDTLDPYCAEPCSYNATSRTKFWGIAAVLIGVEAMRNYMTNRLAMSKDLNFHYEIRGLDFTTDFVIVASPTGLSDPVQVTFPVADKKMAIYVSRAGGWRSDAYDSLLAGVVILAVALAVLMFAALVSRKRHQMLLEALLPKDLIRDLHGTDTTLLDARILQAETTADLMLSLLNRLLEGYMPDLRDVVFIRQAIIRGADLYQPTDLNKHIRDANLDKDVARALMQQLGHETARSSSLYGNSDVLLEDDLGTAPLRGAGSFGTCGHAQQSQHQNQQQQGYTTLTSALALILAPQPTSLRDTHDSMSGDTTFEVNAPQLLARDVDVVNGGSGQVASAGVNGANVNSVGATGSPRPSSLNFVNRALTYFREAGAGGGNTTVTTSAVCRMSMDMSTQQGLELMTTAAAVVVAPAPQPCDATEGSPLPLSLRRRTIVSMADITASAFTGGDHDGDQPRSSAVSVTGAVCDDSTVAPGTTPKRRPPRKVASALGPGAFGVGAATGNLLHRSLLLSLNNSPSGGPGRNHISGGGMLPAAAAAPPPPPLLAAQNSCRRVSVACLLDGGQPLSPDSAADQTGGSNRALLSTLGQSRRTLAAGPNRSIRPPQSLSPAPLPPLPVIEEVERVLALADSWQFDAWRLRDVTNGRPLSALGFYVIQRAGLIGRLNLKPAAVARLLRHIEAGYNDNPYHNATHAADVLQTLHVIIHGAQLHVHYLDQLGLLAAYFAAIVHDYGHPGLTNDFLVATSDPLAVRYNDRSPLENHHAAAAFRLLQLPGLDLLTPLSKSEKATFRKQVIEMVLATDVKQHFSLLSQFNTAHRLTSFAHPPVAAKSNAATRNSGNLNLELKEIVVDVGADCKHSAPKPLDDTERLLSLQLAIKAADLGHLGEDLEVHQRWLSSLEEEFFRQGDKERQLGIPISPLFDRAKQGVSKSQVGFYDFVALPLVHALCSAFPGTQPLMTCFLGNYHYWKGVEGMATNGAHVAPKRGSISVRPEASTSQLPDLEK